MATIITVHGTNAGDKDKKDEGERWWQRGSVFEKHIRELVTGENAELNFQPYHWNGANSEVSRRNAGEELFEIAKDMEAREEPYCFVGHSHGGSVISHSLLKASSEDNSLPHLRKWITTATPFINTKKNKLLYARLNVYGKALYLSFLLYGLLLSIAVWLEPPDNILNIFETIIVFIPIFFVHGMLIRLNSRKLYGFAQRSRRLYSEYFPGRWNCFYHKNDEAIQGLKVVKDVNYAIFPKQFAVSTFVRTSLIITPLLIVIIMLSPSLAKFLINNIGIYISRESDIGDELLAFEPNKIGKSITDLLGVSRDVLDTHITKPLLNIINSLWFGELVGTSVYIAAPYVLIAIALFIVSLISIFVMRLLGIVASLGLSHGLNSLTWGQIRKSAFGDDAREARALAAQECPAWLPRGSSPLPDGLGDKIAQFSDEQA